MFRHKVMPGASGWLKTTSIHPSLLKSRMLAPIVDACIGVAHGWLDGKRPSRGLEYTTGAACQFVTSRSTARSLLRSLAIAPTLELCPANPVSAVTSVNVLLPLLRQRELPPFREFGETSICPSFTWNGAKAVTNRSRSPS